MTVVAGAPEDFTLEAFRRVTIDREGVVIGPAAIRVMAEARAGFERLLRADPGGFIYGVTTRPGVEVGTAIPPEELRGYARRFRGVGRGFACGWPRRSSRCRSRRSPPRSMPTMRPLTTCGAMRQNAQSCSACAGICAARSRQAGFPTRRRSATASFPKSWVRPSGPSRRRLTPLPQPSARSPRTRFTCPPARAIPSAASYRQAASTTARPPPP